MKKLLSLFMAAVTSLSLAACSAKKPEAESTPPGNSQSISVTTEGSPGSTVDISTSQEADSQPTPGSPTQEDSQPPAAEAESRQESLPEDGTYSSKEEVALYIHTYGHLPGNFITKSEARKLGWSGGSVEDYAPGKCIGGDHFGNYEGLLPEQDGRSYTECDIDTLGKGGRGAKRIIFSNDGLIYYTDDHYATFTLLYGEE